MPVLQNVSFYIIQYRYTKNTFNDTFAGSVEKIIKRAL